MSADPEDFFFRYEETLDAIIRETGFSPRAHSRREFQLAEECARQPRGSNGKTERKDLMEARAKTNTELLRQSYIKRIQEYYPFMDDRAKRIAAITIKKLST
ncbi:MAG: hypothetical protein PHT88_04655 [Candidatus Moranbacteria bacterium]|nr:hypothetical protein [Candidatus Moranbacteria bacterium]